MKARSSQALRALLIALPAVVAAGCATLRHDAAAVKLTRDSKDIAGCKELDHVEAFLSLSFQDARTQVQNQAAAQGGNVVLLTSSFGDTVGTAYSCPGPGK